MEFASYTSHDHPSPLSHGLSQYYINKTRAARRHDFFLGTGVGTKATRSSSRADRPDRQLAPQDRRAIIEEAAASRSSRSRRRPPRKARSDAQT